MLKRLRGLLTNDFFIWVEATLIGVFFLQALRYLIGALYARLGSASLFPTVNPAELNPNLPGLVEPVTVTNEIAFVGYMLLLPLIALFFGRWRLLLIPAVVATAAGRYLMNSNIELAMQLDLTGTALAVGGGLLYVVLLIRHRATAFPYMMLFALVVDQLFRAVGDTLDPSWGADYLNVQLILMIVVIVLALINYALEKPPEKDTIAPKRGLMNFWGGVGFGALLFLQVSLLAMPNAIAGRADYTYTLLVPLVVVATLLPLVPFVRGRARRFIALFDSGLRGWLWMFIVMLLIVFGTRLDGVIAAVALLLAQAAISMMWWWLYRPQGEKERNLSGLWLMFGVVVFALLVLFDIFTYEYAFVSDFAPELDFLNPTVPALLRGFRGLGLAVILLGVFLAVMPMVGTQRRIAWVGGKWQLSVFFIAVIAGTSAYAAFEARPPVVQGRVDPDVIRVGTYNIHGGYNEFYYFDLPLMATTISFSGADIVLLQEVEKGRLTSFGVDQALWLSRNLGMDARFFATNEGLQGLAVLSRFEIAFDDGVLLDSRGNQTGLQRVQIVPDGNVITLYNTWLEPLLDTGSGGAIEDLEAAQVAQLNDLLAMIARQFPNGRLGRMIIGGTFNNVPDSDVIVRIRGLGFQDPFEDQQPEVVATLARTGVRARLDYLWTTVANNFQVVESIVVTPPPPDFIPRQASDHLLALIAIALR